jgi:hypothetical protein
MPKVNIISIIFLLLVFWVHNIKVISQNFGFLSSIYLAANSIQHLPAFPWYLEDQIISRRSKIDIIGFVFMIFNKFVYI